MSYPAWVSVAAEDVERAVEEMRAHDVQALPQFYMAPGGRVTLLLQGDDASSTVKSLQRLGLWPDYIRVVTLLDR